MYLGGEQVNNLTSNLALQNQQQMYHQNQNHQNNNLVNLEYPPLDTPPLPPSKNLLATINQQTLKANNNATNEKDSHALTVGKYKLFFNFSLFFFFFALIYTKLHARF